MDSLFSSSSPPRSIAELWQRAGSTYAQLPCCATRRERGRWQAATYAQVFTRAEHLAAALAARGLPSGSLVGLFADHGEEWLVAHAAIQLLGAADVPRGSDVSDQDLHHISASTGMSWAVVASPRLGQRLRAQAPHTLQLVVMSGAAAQDQLSLAALEAEGAACLQQQRDELAARCAALRGEDRHSVIFTSATTGVPKGVVLSHGGMIAQLQAIAAVPIVIGVHDRLLSLLPVWHIFERTVTLAAVGGGASLWFTSPRRFAEDLAEVQPTFMASAPRLWEALDQRIRKALREAHPLRRFLVAAGRVCSHHFRDAGREFRGMRPQLQPRSSWRRFLALLLAAGRWLLFLAPHGLLNTAVLERIRQATGACLKATVSGGGALPPAVDDFFSDLGLPVLEGYGMTEFPVISVRSPQAAVPGTVGQVLPGVELRLVDVDSGAVLWPGGSYAQRGEIQVRGAMRMQEYYRNPPANAAALVEGGWLRTGDLGCMGFDGCLRIVGRCKDTIVLRSGENVEPAPIEEALAASDLIAQVVVVGQDAKHLSVLVVPDVEALTQALGEAELSLAQLAEHQGAQQLLRQELRRLVNREAGFKSFELIHGLGILPAELEVGRELTNLLKVRRHVVQDRYAELIARLGTEA